MLIFHFINILILHKQMTKKIKLFKDFTYYSLIKDAIYHAPCKMATSNDIFNYFANKYPTLFLSSNSQTWKGNIRQVLSKNPEFVKLRKLNNSKQHFWTHKPLEVLQQEEMMLLSCLDTQRNIEQPLAEDELNDIYLRINNVLNKSIIDNRMKHNSMTFQNYNGSIFQSNNQCLNNYKKHKETMDKIETFIDKMELEAKKENISEMLMKQIKERRLSREYNKILEAGLEKQALEEKEEIVELVKENSNNIIKKIEPIPSYNIQNNINSEIEISNETDNKNKIVENHWDFNEEKLYKRF